MKIEPAASKDHSEDARQMVAPDDWKETARLALEALNRVHSVYDVVFVDGVRSRLKAVIAAPAELFQARVQPWMMACFGAEIAADQQERNHRFLEEALELVQRTGCTASEAHQLVDYVMARPVGELHQEVGGVMVTLAALCLTQGVDMHECGEVELARIWTKVEQIRAKQAAKPKHSPLPQHVPAASPADQVWRDGVIADLRAALADRDQARAEVKRRDELANGTVWFWQGDKADDLDSLTCQVVIRAEDLRAMAATTPAARDLLAERRRQVTAEGWTPAHDDEHANGEMAMAAATYAAAGSLQGADRSVITTFGAEGTPYRITQMWPWAREWWKPATQRRDLVKAGALILAELERIDRAAMSASMEGA